MRYRLSTKEGPHLEALIGKSVAYARKGGVSGIPTSGAEVYIQNGGDSGRVLECVENEKARGGLEGDIIILNSGLHDVKTNRLTGEIQVPIGDYIRNVTATIDVLLEGGLAILWVNSTPVEYDRHYSLNTDFLRYNRDVVKYNDAAQEIMERYNIYTIDLYSFCGEIEGNIYCDHVHFAEEVRMLQASFIAGHIYMFSQLNIRG